MGRRLPVTMVSPGFGKSPPMATRECSIDMHSAMSFALKAQVSTT